jgi:hypothetical protein
MKPYEIPRPLPRDERGGAMSGQEPRFIDRAAYEQMILSRMDLERADQEAGELKCLRDRRTGRLFVLEDEKVSVRA